LARAKSTKREELSAEDMELIVRPLQAWGHAIGTCFLVIHHHRKSATGDVIWDPRGSGAIVGVADVALGIYEEEDGYRFVTRSRDAPELSYQLSFEEGIWTQEEEFKIEDASDLEQLAIDEVKQKGKITSAGLSEMGDVTPPTARATLNKLVKRGRLVCNRRVMPHVYTLSPEQAELDLDREVSL
jgi:hypothetical protein